MHTVEFEANIINGVIEVPQKYKDLHDKYVKVTLYVEKEIVKEEKEEPACEIEITDDKSLMLDAKAEILDLSQINIACFNDVNPVEYQRKIRDAR